jgi:hypothetical protein
MCWQRYLLLAGFTLLPSYAGVLPKREQASNPAGPSSGSPLKLCSVDYYCDWSQQICRPQLGTRAIPLSIAQLPRHERYCDPLGFLTSNPSKWCTADQYCDPVQWVCKPQLATRAVPLHTTQLPMSRVKTSPSNYEAHIEISKRESLATTGMQRCPSRGLTPLRCPVGQYCEPFTRVCKPFLLARTGEDEVSPQLQAISNKRECDPLGFQPKQRPDDQYCDIIKYVYPHRSPATADAATQATLPSGADSSSPDASPSKSEEQIDTPKQDSSAYFKEQQPRLDGEQSCYAWGELGGPEIFCPARQYCDRTDYVCRRPKQTVSMKVLTVLPTSATQRSPPGPNQRNTAEPIGISKVDSLANYSERELPPYDLRECYPFGDYGGPEKWCPVGQYCDIIDYVCRSDARVVSEVAQAVSLPSGTKSPSSETTLNNAEEHLDLPLLVAISGSESGPGPSAAPQHPNPGIFTVIGSSGVPAMHAALMPNGRVVFLDKVEDYSPLSLANGRLAFSSEFDPVTRQVVPLAYNTNAFCSAGTFLADGRVISVGGNGPLSYLDPTVSDGFDGIRYLERSATDQSLDGRSWSEPGNKLASKRWYASAQTMPDGSVFVASGSLTGLVITDNANNNPTYEVLDANAVTMGRNLAMDILVNNQPYYLYPFLHLLRDGSLFVFTSKSSQVFSVSENRIIREMPDLVGLYRTYPDSGGSVMLPLRKETGYAADVIICGGGAYVDVTSPTEASCGRIQPESDTPSWEMDAMPEGRVMVEGTLLPDGTILWLNGAQTGAQGFGIADDPALDALIYDPQKALGQRWSLAGRSDIPRLYHSVAVLLLDGTVLVAGGNPNEQPVLPENINPSVMAQKYPTEYRVEIYTPPYLIGEKASRRPQNVVISNDRVRPDGSTFEITFTAPEGGQHGQVLLIHGGFITHGLHMGHRMVLLDHEGGEGHGGEKRLRVQMPEARFGNNVLPPGPYVLYVVVDGVPSIGQFVMVD